MCNGFFSLSYKFFSPINYNQASKHDYFFTLKIKSQLNILLCAVSFNFFGLNYNCDSLVKMNYYYYYYYRYKYTFCLLRKNIVFFLHKNCDIFGHSILIFYEVLFKKINLQSLCTFVVCSFFVKFFIST